MPSSITKPQNEPLTFKCSNSLCVCNEYNCTAFNCLRPFTRNSKYRETMRCQKGNNTWFWNKNYFSNCIVPMTSVNFLHSAKMLKYTAFCRLNSIGVWQHYKTNLHWGNRKDEHIATQPVIGNNYRIVSDAMALVDCQGHLGAGSSSSNSQFWKCLLNEGKSHTTPWFHQG